MFSSITLVFVSFFAFRAAAECSSYGWDFVQDGTYCIDTRITDPFSFGTGFEGCTPDDSQGGITPILVGPDNEDYYCSDIQTNPDNTEMISTCNLGQYDTILKSQMTSGNWTVVIEGLTFAKMRQFNIIAGIPATVTSTPTATVTATTTPTTTTTSTTTSVIPTTLAPSTVTKPSTTIVKTVTTTPKLVIATSTKLSTITIPKLEYGRTTTTITKTAACSGPRRWDPKNTLHPAKASLAAAATMASPKSRVRRAQMENKARAAPLDAAALARRSPDACTSTTLAATAVTSIVTETAPVSTIVSTVVATATSTITPPPVTALSGKASTTITITAPTPTFVITKYGLTTTVVTKTILATVTSTVKVQPTGGCL